MGHRNAFYVENCFLIYGQVFSFVDLHLILHRVLISTICIFQILDFQIMGNAGQPANADQPALVQAGLQPVNLYVVHSLYALIYQAKVGSFILGHPVDEDYGRTKRDHVKVSRLQASLH